MLEKSIYKSIYENKESITFEHNHSYCKELLLNCPLFADYKDSSWENLLMHIEDSNVFCKSFHDKNTYIIFDDNKNRDIVYLWIEENILNALPDNENTNESITDSEVSEAIYYALEMNEFEKLEGLLKKGLDINSPIVFDELEFSIDDFNKEIILHFINLGLQINHPVSRALYPLWFSYIYDANDINEIKDILSLPGLDINSKTGKGENILFKIDYCLRDVNPDNRNELLIELVTLFSEKGLDIIINSSEGSNLLFKMHNYPDLMKLLVTLGLDINLKNSKGISPFMNLCMNIDIENEDAVIEEWLNCGAEINATVPLGQEKKEEWSPLFFAVKSKNISLVESLLEHEASINHKTKNGLTAYELALETGKKEILELIKKYGGEPENKTPEIITKLIDYSMIHNQLDEAISWGEQLPEEKITKWEVYYQLSSAYLKSGNIELSLSMLHKCREKFGINNYIIDAYIYFYVLTQNWQEAIDFWEQYKKDFAADTDPAANTIAHLIIAFDNSGHPEKAIEELYPFMETADKTKASKPGLHRFNMACMFAKVSKTKECVLNSLEAIKNGYTRDAFEDSDFDLIRDDQLFQIFLHYIDAKILHTHLALENKNVTIYSRSENTLEKNDYDGKIYSYENININSSYELLEKYEELIYDYKNKGFIQINQDFISIWLPVFDDLFKQIAATTTEPIGGLRIEWDFNYSDGEDVNNFERPYYCYTDNGFELDHYDYLLYIPEKHIHHSVISEAVKLESFKTLKKKDTIKIIQSEHDGGDEFIETLDFQN